MPRRRIAATVVETIVTETEESMRYSYRIALLTLLCIVLFASRGTARADSTVVISQTDSSASDGNVHAAETSVPDWRGVQKLDVSLAIGGVQVLEGDGTITVRKSAEDQVRLSRMRVFIIRDGKTLRIRTASGPSRIERTETGTRSSTHDDGSYDLAVNLPPGLILALATLHSDVGSISIQHASMTTGDLSVHDGSVTIRNASLAVAKVSVDVGSVMISDSALPRLTASTENGMIALNALSQPLAADLTVAAGKIAARDVTFAGRSNTIRVEQGVVDLTRIGRVHVVADISSGSARLSGGRVVSDADMAGGHWESGDASDARLDVHVEAGSVTQK